MLKLLRTLEIVSCNKQCMFTLYSLYLSNNVLQSLLTVATTFSWAGSLFTVFVEQLLY